MLFANVGQFVYNIISLSDKEKAMQFRMQKNGRRVQVLAYRGYDKEKKRAIIKVLGSIGRYDYDLSDGLESSLSGDDEKNELQSYIEKMRQDDNKFTRLCKCKFIARSIKTVADSIADGEFAELDAAWADETWAAIEDLTKALKKAGYSKPKKAATAEPCEGQAALPLDD